MNKIMLLGGEPGDISELLVPMARIFVLPQDPIATLKAMVKDLPYKLGGRAAKPVEPLVMRTPNGVNIIPGFGVTEAAELQDLAYRQIERHQDDWRDRFGFPSRDTFDTRFREHMDWRAKHPNDHPQPMSSLDREARRRSIPIAK